MSQQLILQKLERNFLQLRQDLEQLAATPTEAALQGKCSAALGTIDRQMRELSDMVQREPDMERRRELKTKHSQWTEDGNQLRQQYERLKRQQLERAQQERERQLLLQQQPTSPPQGDVSITIGGNAANPLNLTAEQRIDRSMANSNAYVDSYLQMGEAALDKLKKQGWILKATRKRLLDTAHQMGLSQRTIRWIDRRTQEDQWIFWAGVVITLLIMGFTIYYVRG